MLSFSLFQEEELRAVRRGLRRKVLEIIQLLDDGVPTEDTLDMMLYKLDWIHAVLMRLCRVQHVPEAVFNQIVVAGSVLQEYFQNCNCNASAPCSTTNPQHQRGRPSFDISMETLDCLLSRNFTVPDIASMLNVSVRTIRNRMTAYNLAVGNSYTRMTDDELDEQVLGIMKEFPNTGYKHMMGHLKSKGLRIGVMKVRESMRRVDPMGIVARSLQLRTIRRRKYNVPHPNALWHLDGNHKLIRYTYICLSENSVLMTTSWFLPIPLMYIVAGGNL